MDRVEEKWHSETVVSRHRSQAPLAGTHEEYHVASRQMAGYKESSNIA